MSITEKFLRAGPHPIGGRTVKRYRITTFEAEIEPGIQKAVPGEPYLGCPDTNPEHFGVLEPDLPDLPDLTGYISDTLPEGRTGGAK